MRPNVLSILTDQQHPDTLGFRGQTPCKTPYIDRLAAEGISLDNAATPSPLCLPARAALFSGRYPTQTDMMSNATGQLRSREWLEAIRDPLAGDLDTPDRPAVFAMHQPLGGRMHTTDWRMIRLGRAKYVWHLKMAHAVFDLSADPGELVKR